MFSKLQIWLCFFLVALCISAMSCGHQGSDKNADNTIPVSAASGDSLALDLALKMENAAGGMDNWNKTRFLSFNFFGSRYWYWDIPGGRYRVESDKYKYRIAGYIDGSITRLWLNGEVVMNPDSILRYADLAHRTWVNDTYWLILPFKLSDPGLHLTYLGSRTTPDSIPAECLELTFRDVGITPDNKYRLYADPKSFEIIHWEYFRKQTDSLSTISTSWTKYMPYGNIFLSGGRGNRTITDIEVFEKLPDKIFTDLSRSAAEIMKDN